MLGVLPVRFLEQTREKECEVWRPCLRLPGVFKLLRPYHVAE